MLVEYKADSKVTDAECRKATGKTLKEWFKELDSQPEFNRKRRDSIQWMYDLSGRGSDVWWPTTIWVEYEKVLGIVNRKDGQAEGFNICSTKSVTATIAEIWVINESTSISSPQRCSRTGVANRTLFNCSGPTRNRHAGVAK